MAWPGTDPTPPPDREAARQQAVLQHLLVRGLRRQPRLIPLLVAGLVACQVLLPNLGRGGGDNPLLPVLLAFGHLDQAIRHGEWWRLATSWALHQGSFHLIGNVLFLVILGRPVEAAYGPARTWLICVAAGLAGSLLALNAHTPIMVGASGVVMGLCGATLALGVRLWSFALPALRFALVYAPAAFLLLRLSLDGLFGEVEHLNPYAHQGGALAGFAVGLWLRPQLPGLGVERIYRSWTRLGVAITTLLIAVAYGQALARLRHPVRLPSVHTQDIALDGAKLVLPAGLPRGVWSRGQCVGEHTDVAWALQTGRTVCYTLEPFGLLLLDRRDHLLTLDAQDVAALRAADQTGRFVQSEPHVMLYPLGEHLLWLLQAPDPALRWHASALIPLLPPPGSAVVRAPPLTGHWLLPWQIALALVRQGAVPEAMDLGDGVQLLVGQNEALLDPHGRDAVPLAVAGRTQQFARLQPGVMAYPLPTDRLAVLLGPDSRLDEFALRLVPLLPPALPLPSPPLAVWYNWLAAPLGLPLTATPDDADQPLR